MLSYADSLFGQNNGDEVGISKKKTPFQNQLDEVSDIQKGFIFGLHLLSKNVIALKKKHLTNC